MAHPRNERHPPGSSRRPFPSRDEHDDRMYDDHSRSRSPVQMRDNDRARSPHRGPPAESRAQYSRDRESGQGFRDYDRGEYRHRNPHSPPRRGRNTYRDRDREGYRSGSYSRSRSRSPRRGQSHFGQVSREVMMDGLPVDMTEEHISAELSNAYHVDDLEDIRVIRDRQTKLSRQLGFLRFSSVDASRAFLERNHPFIYLYGPSAGAHDRSTKVRIAYSREREDRARAKGTGDWNCRKCFIVNFSTRPHCFKCGSSRPDMDPTGPPGVPTPKVANDGDSDAAPDKEPSQFLLVRGLEASVTEELLAKGVSKLYRPSGTIESAPSNQKKGSKVASTTGDSNLGAPEGSLRRVLLVRDRRTNESWRYGFAEFAGVVDAQAAMARLKSFEKFTISSKPVLVTYIHAGVFVPVVNPSSSASRYTFSPANNSSLQLMYWDDAAYVTELKLSANEENAAQDQAGDMTVINQQEAQVKGTKDSDKPRKRKAEATTANANAKKLSMPSQLQFWSNRHAELHANKVDGETHAETASEVHTSVTEPATLPDQSFADFDNNTCYLCWRMFDNAEHIIYHENTSEVHQENLQNEELRERTMREMIKHGVVATQVYRDRAKERRQAFGPGKSANAIANADSSVLPDTSYADFNQLTCLLCAQDFERPEVLVLHERHDQDHEKNMQDDFMRAHGDRNMIKYGLAPLPTPTYRAFADEDEPASSYADLKENTCYLCQLRFPAPEEVLFHERISNRHRENLKDKEIRAHGDCRLIKHGLATLPTQVYRAFSEDSETISSYAHLKAMCCLLCDLEFTKPEHVLLHERLDEVHRKNLKDIETRAHGDCALIVQGLASLPAPIYRLFAEDVETVSSYADMKERFCFLCEGTFPTPESVFLHERLNKTHLENLKNKEERARGDYNLIECGVVPLPKPVYRFSAEDFDSDEADGKRASSYADLENNGCVLCKVSSSKPHDVFVHERFSPMHRENLKNKENREAALFWLVKNGVVEAPDIYGDNANQKRLEKQRAAFYSDDPSAPPDVSYIDPKTKSCWLCWADFKGAEETILHERMSEAHRENLKDQSLRVRARNAFINTGALEERQDDEHRAAEGREASTAESSNARQKAAEAAHDDQVPAQTTSIGASLLRKMGWSQGSGLGAEGTGVTAPISTDVYAPGVGLGAQGGRLGDAVEEAGRNTRGRYEEFLEKTKDNARQRYEQMDES